MEITKELVAKLSDENITKKEYSAIANAISDKANEIWRYIIKATPSRKLEWWGFSNDMSLGHGNGSTGGEFNPETDSEFIEVVGDNTHWNNDFYDWNDGFPTELLWDKDYQTTVEAYISGCKAKQIIADKKKAEKNDIKKNKKKQLIESVKSKLTKEELSVVSFKG